MTCPNYEIKSQNYYILQLVKTMKYVNYEIKSQNYYPSHKKSKLLKS